MGEVVSPLYNAKPSPKLSISQYFVIEKQGRLSVCVGGVNHIFELIKSFKAENITE